MRFKVGDIVVAIDDGDVYTCTNIKNKWVGRIIRITGSYFRAKTIFANVEWVDEGEEFQDLCFDYFITLNQAIKDGVDIEI